jgi:DNA-binding NtrC family response regulator
MPSSSMNETKLLLAQEDTALVICQASFSDGDFRDLLRVAVRNGSKVPVIVCTDFYDPSLYLEAMELGAFDYLASPYYRDGVEWVVGNALREASVPHRALSVGSA